jgi:hypothetical protein
MQGQGGGYGGMQGSQGYGYGGMMGGQGGGFRQFNPYAYGQVPYMPRAQWAPQQIPQYQPQQPQAPQMSAPPAGARPASNGVASPWGPQNNPQSFGRPQPFGIGGAFGGGFNFPTRPMMGGGGPPMSTGFPQTVQPFSGQMANMSSLWGG